MRVCIKELCMKLAAIFFGLIFALMVGEVVIRILEPRSDTKGIQLEKSARLFGLQGNSRGYAGGVEFETNSSGFRTGEFNYDLNDEELRVIVIGDSYAFGYGVSEGSSFPSILQKNLNREYPDKRVRVINLGIPGYNTAQELATLREVGLSLRPKLVLLAYHLNDIERLSESRNERVWTLKGILDSAKEHIHLLRYFLPRVVSLARSFHIGVKSTATAEVQEYITEGPAWKQNQDTLKELFGLCAKMHWRLGIVVLPYIVDLSDRHPCIDAYQEVVVFCRAQGVPVVNTFDYFRGLNARKLWINAFDGHPNAEGHALIAKAAADLVKTESLLQ